LRHSCKRVRPTPGLFVAERFASRGGIAGAAAFLAKAEPIAFPDESEHRTDGVRGEDQAAKTTFAVVSTQIADAVDTAPRDALHTLDLRRVG
jgi:hypothetical protein